MRNPTQAMARMIAILNQETFRRKAINANKPLNKSSHPGFSQIFTDDVWTRLVPSTVTKSWGLRDASDLTAQSPQAGRWSESSHWGS